VQAVASVENPRQITWIHFEGRIPDVLAFAIPQIRSILSHAIISIEFEKPDRPGLIDLLPLADVAFFSHSFFMQFQSSNGGDPTPNSFFKSMRLRNSHGILILTTGSTGAACSFPGDEISVSAPHVEHVVDTVGAGDTFIAGFIWSVGKLKRTIPDSLRLAVNLASTKVEQEGFNRVWELLGIKDR